MSTARPSGASGLREFCYSAVARHADLVIFDPQRKHTISVKTHHMRVDYSMFEGIQGDRDT